VKEKERKEDYKIRAPKKKLEDLQIERSKIEDRSEKEKKCSRRYHSQIILITLLL